MEERGTKNYTNSHDAIIHSDYDYGWNACQAELLKNIENYLTKI